MLILRTPADKTRTAKFVVRDNFSHKHITEMTRAFWSDRGHIWYTAQRSFIALGQWILSGQKNPADDQYADTNGGYSDENASAGRLTSLPVAQWTEQLGRVVGRHNQRARWRHVRHLDDVTVPRDRKRSDLRDFHCHCSVRLESTET